LVFILLVVRQTGPRLVKRRHIGSRLLCVGITSRIAFQMPFRQSPQPCDFPANRQDSICLTLSDALQSSKMKAEGWPAP